MDGDVDAVRGSEVADGRRGRHAQAGIMTRMASRMTARDTGVRPAGSPST
jgi:hypothetical protein